MDRVSPDLTRPLFIHLVISCFCYYCQCQQLNQKESSKKPEEGFWHILLKLTQASLGMKDFVINKLHRGHLALLCSVGAELQTEKTRSHRSFSSGHFLQSRHEKCGLVSLLVQRDDAHYVASPSLCCYEMAGAEGLEVISRRNSMFAPAKHLLYFRGPPTGKYFNHF